MKGKILLHQIGFNKEQPDIIHIDSDAFEKLLDAVIEYAGLKREQEKNIWISEEEVFAITGISSKGTLLKLRANGRIRYSQAFARVIMYDKNSVLKFMEDNARNTF